MLAGLSRFLVQHERCGAGFDVAHPAGLGSGRVSITCRGCGARHEYATATIEVEREVRIEPAPPAQRVERPAPRSREAAPRAPRRPARIPPRPAPYPDMQRHAGEEMVTPEQAPPREPIPATARPRSSPAAESALRRVWRSPGTTVALVAVALLALGFGVIAILDDDGDNPPVQPASSPPPAPAPAPEAPGPVGSPVPGANQPPTSPVRTERFTLEVPRGWSKRTESGGLVLEPGGGGRVEVQVYYQRSPGLSRTRMAQQTSQFLAGEVPGAALFPGEVEIDGRPAYELTARGPGETAIAVNVLRGPYRYLLVRRIFAGAKPQTSQTAGRVVLSFRPL
jgi:hypothetical protein